MTSRIFSFIVGPHVPQATGATLDYGLPEPVDRSIRDSDLRVVSHTAERVEAGLFVTLYCESN